MGHIYLPYIIMPEPDDGQLELIGTDPNLTGGDVFKHCIITGRKTCRIIYYSSPSLDTLPMPLCTIVIWQFKVSS